MWKVADHENHVRWIYLTTVLRMGEGQKYARRKYNYITVEGKYREGRIMILQWRGNTEKDV